MVNTFIFFWGYPRMSVELTMLFWASILTFVQVVVAVLFAIGQFGLPEVAGNRADLGTLNDMAGRAKRAHANMLESLVLFAVLVLIVQIAGLSSDLTVLGAQIFVGARLVYAIVYLVGVPWLRTGVWSISVAGLAIMAWPILTA